MKKKSILTIIGAIVVLCLVLVVIGSFLDGDTPTTTPAPLAQNSPATLTSLPPTATQIPPTNTPTDVPEPTPTIPPQEAFRAALSTALGDSNRDLDRIVKLEFGETLVIDFTINENLTEDLIRYGAKMDFVTILKLLSVTEIPFTSASISGSYSLVDLYGNASETMVVYGLYTKDIISKINFSNFITDNVYILAEENFIAPAFQDQE